jgi:hypothetical protein
MRQQAHILEIDPFDTLKRVDADIPEEYRDRRDLAWAAIKSLVVDHRLDMFCPKSRGPLIAQCEQKTGHNRKVLYEWISKYFRGGMFPNTLLPRWDVCGSQGKPRNVTKQLGRPPKTVSQQSSDHEEHSFFNVDEHTRDLLLNGYRKFYEKNPKNTWEQAYLKTMGLYFNIGHEIKNGVLSPILAHPSQRPTLRQFQYHVRKEINADLGAFLKRHLGERQFRARYRPVLGSAVQQAFGPTSEYEIDAWIADVAVVSALNRNWIIGRPTIYVVVDVFSWLIVGLHVTLEAPSWEGAMLALENTCEDKVAFCAKYGITITPDMWPNGGFPGAVRADRGEFEGWNADMLTQTFGVDAQNTRAHSGDFKPLAEREFLLSKQRTFDRLPATINELKQRGERDCRLDACCTVYEIMQIAIGDALLHNTNWRMTNYRLDQFAIQDDVEPYPILLWYWGIKNRSGALRQQPSRAQIRKALLRRGEASITPSGIRFKGVSYRVESGNDEDMYVRARALGWKKVPVSYNNKHPHTIYIRDDKNDALIPCKMLPTEISFQSDQLDFQDIEHYFEVQSMRAEQARAADQQAKMDQIAFTDEVIARAQQEAAAARDGQSDRSRLSNIREHREHDRSVERREEAQRERELLAPETAPTPPHQPAPSPSSYVPPAPHFDLIEQLLTDTDDSTDEDDTNETERASQ